MICFEKKIIRKFMKYKVGISWQEGKAKNLRRVTTGARTFEQQKREHISRLTTERGDEGTTEVIGRTR